jgi:hypothetical protein
MKSILLLSALMLACHLSFAEDGIKTAAQQKQQCEFYVSSQKVPQADICFAYARGLKDAMDGDLSWLDDAHRNIGVGSWAEGVTVDQLVRVFVKFANENPALLNQSAFNVFRQSAEIAGLYTFSSPGK